MEIKQIRFFKFVPPNFKLEKKDICHIIQRSIIIEVTPDVEDDNPNINFIIEEMLYVDYDYLNKNTIPLTRFIHNTQYFKKDLPKHLHLILDSLALYEVTGSTAQSFVASLFYEIYIKNNIESINKYFPTWSQSIANKSFEEILKLNDEVIKNDEN